MSFGILRKPAIIISFFFTINPSQNPSYKTIKLPFVLSNEPIENQKPRTVRLLLLFYCCFVLSIKRLLVLLYVFIFIFIHKPRTNVCLFYCTCSSSLSFTNPEIKSLLVLLCSQTFACFVHLLVLLCAHSSKPLFETKGICLFIFKTHELRYYFSF